MESDRLIRLSRLVGLALQLFEGDLGDMRAWLTTPHSSLADHAVVYVSETRALSLLEVLAGLATVKPVQSYVLSPVTFDDSLVLPVPSEELPATWRQSPPPPSTQGIGDAWVDDRRSVILRVPSAIGPEEFNYLLNPGHPDFRLIHIGTPQDVTIDSRLFP